MVVQTEGERVRYMHKQRCYQAYTTSFYSLLLIQGFFCHLHRESDIGLILLITSVSDPTASPTKAASRKRKADTPQDEKGPEATICIPAHRVVLMAKSDYFSRRLCTAVGEIPTGTVKEHAASLDELHAMEGVLEFMYTDQLPLLCTQDKDSANGSSGGSITLFKRQLLTLMVRLIMHHETMRCVLFK